MSFVAVGVGLGAAGSIYGAVKSGNQPHATGPTAAAGFVSGINQDQTDASYFEDTNAVNQAMAFQRAAQVGGLSNQSAQYNQLANVANGTGPNPALDQLNNTTGANVANQAALMASQRGTSANPGMIARLAAQQGAATQQQAVGQGAALESQQRLNAMQAAAGVAGQQVAEQGAANAAYTNAAQNWRQSQLNQQANFDASVAGVSNSNNTTNAGIDQNQAQMWANLGSNLGKVGGSLGSLGGASSGGGGGVDLSSVNNSSASNSLSLPALGSSAEYAKGGTVEKISPVMAHLTGQRRGLSVGTRLMQGGNVPGKPAVGGAKNSYKNDTVSAKLSPGEIVIPRSITMGNDPVNKAAAFVAATMAKSGKMPRK